MTFFRHLPPKCFYTRNIPILQTKFSHSPPEIFRDFYTFLLFLSKRSRKVPVRNDLLYDTAILTYKIYIPHFHFQVRHTARTITKKVLYLTIHSFIHSSHFYSTPSSLLLLRCAPDYSTDTVSEFHAEAHTQLQVKDLPKVPTWRLERESNPQPSG